MVVGSTWKDFDNYSNWGIAVCTSTTRPTAYDGRPIYETDTNKFLIWDGAAWTEVGGGAAAGDFYADGSVPMTGNLTINKSNPGILLKPTVASSPTVDFYNVLGTIDGTVYTVDAGDMVVLGEKDLYLSTVITTGGSVFLETKGIPRLTIADTVLTASIPLAMGANKITGLGAATANGDALRYEQLIGAYLPLTGGTLTGNLTIDSGNLRVGLSTDDITPPTYGDVPKLIARSIIGGPGVVGWSRSSEGADGRMGCQGISGFVDNDSLNSAYAGYLEARKTSALATHTHALEAGIINSINSDIDVIPSSMVPIGATYGLWSASGRGDVTSYNASVGLGINDNGASFRRGIVIGGNALSSIDGKLIAMEVGYNQRLCWGTDDHCIVGTDTPEIWTMIDNIPITTVSATGLYIDGILRIGLDTDDIVPPTYGGVPTIISKSLTGDAAIIGWSQTSDGADSRMGTMGISGYAQANSNSSCYAGYFEVRKTSSLADYTHGIEVGIINTVNSIIDVTPTVMDPLGATYGLWISAGRSDVTPAYDISVGLGFKNNPQKFRRAIVVASGAVSDLGSGKMVAMEVADNQRISWGDDDTCIVGSAGTDFVGLMIQNDFKLKIDSTATNSVLLFVDGSLKRVYPGPPDSGGAGYKQLIVPN